MFYHHEFLANVARGTVFKYMNVNKIRKNR